MAQRPSLWTDRPDDWLASAEPPRDDAPTTVAPPPPPPPRRPRRRLVATGAAVALTGVLLGAYTLGAEQDGSGDEPVQALPAAGGTLQANRTQQIVSRASKGVVSIRVNSGRATASGTGFVLDTDGTIVTNAHVVENATRAQVRFDDNGAAVDGEVVGTDPSSDLAVIRVDPDDADLAPLPLADSDQVKVGDQAIAIGYPLGLDRTATSGIISGLGRQIEAPNGFSIDEVLQTDAPINPGNSGGPLLDARGRVVGVNSQIATAGGGGGSVGIGFAVPANTVREVVPQLKSGQSVERAWLGVSTGSLPNASGAEVGQVVTGSPADRAGLREGDVITEVDGKPVNDPNDVSQAVNDAEVGEDIQVEVRRGAEKQSLGVTLGKRPAQASP